MYHVDPQLKFTTGSGKLKFGNWVFDKTDKTESFCFCWLSKLILRWHADFTIANFYKKKTFTTGQWEE